jgi:predicted transposase YdaD
MARPNLSPEAGITPRTFQFQSAYARRLRAEGKAEGRAEGKAEGRAEGKAEGEAAAVLEVLDARGFDVPDDVRARIAACSDVRQLKMWIRRAATVRMLDELFN